MYIDILIEIFIQLDITDILVCSQVNRLWNKVLYNNFLWNCIISKYFGNTTKDYVCYGNYNNFETYKICYKFQKLSNKLGLSYTIIDLSNLQILDINNKNINLIPQEVRYLTNLRVFNASNNLISEIPDFFCQLNLISIDLQNNLITEIPYYISNLKNLKLLNLHNNKIKNITNKINKLIKLEMIGLSSNNITYIPSTISELQNLKIIGLKNNNIISIPVQILRNCFL